MDYQVWIKDEFEDKYTKAECGDLPAAKRMIDEAVRKGGEPILTVEVPYSLAIKVEEPGAVKPKFKREPKKPEESKKEESESEASQSKAEPDQSPGAES